MKWTPSDGDLGDDISEIRTEVDGDGQVTRELGFDPAGRVIHRMPSNQYREGTYGFFDLAAIDLSSHDRDIAAPQFEERWIASGAESEEE